VADLDVTDGQCMLEVTTAMTGMLDLLETLGRSILVSKVQSHTMCRGKASSALATGEHDS
jgi:hypothetical protein